MAKKPSYEELAKRVAELEKEVEESRQTQANVAEHSSRNRELLDQLNFKKALFDTIPSPVFYKDRAGVYQDCNAAFARLILGLPPEQVIGCTLYDLPRQIPRHLADIYQRQDTALIENPGLQVYESQVRCADGVLRDFIFYKSTYCDHLGEVVGIVGVMLDVTEKNEIWERLEESEEKYRSMMESMSDAVYICSSDLTISYMNPKMVELVGYDATGQKCHRVLHDLESPCTWCTFPEVRKGKVVEAEVTSPRNGRTYMISNAPIYHRDGSFSKMTIYRDITRRIHLENELLMARKLEAAGVFAGGIAHDYNNLLFIILGNLLLLKKEASISPKARTMLDEAENAAQKVANLTKRLLAFTHNEQLNLERIVLDDVLSDVVANMQEPGRYTFGLQLIGTPLIIHGDSGLVAKVFTDIIGNSKEAMAGGGRITIEGKTIMVGNDCELLTSTKLDIAGEYVQVRITDEGPGIPENVRPHIFDPYFSTKIRGTKKGLGLGLSTAYSILKKHSGAITCESNLGGGTTISVYLPVENPASKKKVSPLSQDGLSQ